nr:hypothetical protein Iba_chr05bCG0640 [Ipomoea batatas]GMC96741.1 hypothetical protein Iba_chr05dCG0820 [Ipomoea batatas]GMC98915.1 hypothetical protein Iba_chr05eCG0710 [Ipomoea batatas]
MSTICTRLRLFEKKRNWNAAHLARAMFKSGRFQVPQFAGLRVSLRTLKHIRNPITQPPSLQNLHCMTSTSFHRFVKLHLIRSGYPHPSREQNDHHRPRLCTLWST